MKKIAFALLLLFGLIPIVQSQTVDSIKVEQAGDLIKIHYKILNSNQYQIFRVAVFCSINGGLKSELKSLSGDSGDNVSGGKSDYLVLWDVLKDVDEVKSVDFSVRAELVKDATPKKDGTQNKDAIQTLWEKERFYVLPGFGEGWGIHWGARIGYMGNWGFSARYMIGTQNDGDLPKPESYYQWSIDLTKRIVSKGKFQMHILAGIAGGKIYGESNGNYFWETHELTYEAGLALGIGRVAFSLAIVPYSKHDGSFYPFRNQYSNIEIGVRF